MMKSKKTGLLRSSAEVTFLLDSTKQGFALQKACKEEKKSYFTFTYLDLRYFNAHEMILTYLEAMLDS